MTARRIEVSSMAMVSIFIIFELPQRGSLCIHRQEYRAEGGDRYGDKKIFFFLEFEFDRTGKMI